MLNVAAKGDFVAVEDRSHEEVDRILALASRVKAGGIRGGLEGKVLAMVFLDPSLRTRTSFEAGMFLHGGTALTIEPGKGSWPLETERGAVMDGDRIEHVIDAARVLGRYADFVALRSFPRGASWSEARRDAILTSFVTHCEKPVINLESARRHPCQELGDLLTIRERVPDTAGRRFALVWAWHPRPLPTAVPVSAALAAARLGMELVIARPEGYDLDDEDMTAIRRLAAERGGTVEVTDDAARAVRGAQVVYAKSWGALGLFGDAAGEAALRAPLRGWRIGEDHMRSTRGGEGIFLHCLPVRRNVEVDDAVLDGPSSAVVDQAENRLHAQRALLLTLAEASRARADR
jgi:N-acetylornithine carbamoyltransferase